MTERARILVVAATARELATPDGWLTLLCGVGPVEAAARTWGATGAGRATATRFFVDLAFDLDLATGFFLAPKSPTKYGLKAKLSWQSERLHF